MFSDTERAIFGPYFNGIQTVYADPIRVHRRLYAKLDGDPNKWFERMRVRKDEQGNPLPEDQQVPLQERNSAKERVLEAGLYALDITPFDPVSARGATENDIMAALRAYLEFRAKKKVSGQMQPPCSPCTQVSPNPFYQAPSPMRPIMASGSIPPGPGWLGPGKS